MLVVYDSKTGNVQRFVDKLDMKVVKISKNLVIDEPYVLVTFTTGFGEIPDTTLKFIQNNYTYLQGVASSGNMNWGMSYAKAADLISQLYKVPVIMKFELSGTKKDVEKFKQEVMKIANNKSYS